MTDDQKKARARGGQEGKLEIILAWNSTRDIDLYVTCPTGQVLWARALTACAGELDIDANGSGNAKVGDPVEHAVYPQPGRGTYRVAVGNCERSGPAESYRLTVIYEGKVIRQVSGTAPVTGFVNGCGTPIPAVEFSIPP